MASEKHSQIGSESSEPCGRSRQANAPWERQSPDWRSHNMRTPRICLLFLALFGLIESPSLKANTANTKKTVTYSKKVPFGLQEVKIGATCIVFGGSMTSGVFFENLRNIQSQGRTEYRLKGQPVASFPDSLTIEIVAIPRNCDRHVEDELASENQELMDHLTFGVQWKKGVTMTSADQPIYGGFKHTREPLPLSPYGDTADMWKFTITIKSTGVSLDQHVIVSVYTENGKDIARLSSSL